MGALCCAPDGAVVHADAGFQALVFPGGAPASGWNAFTLPELSSFRLAHWAAQVRETGQARAWDAELPQGEGTRRLRLLLAPLSGGADNPATLMLLAEDAPRDVAERERLIGQRDEARRSVQIKGEFLASMSHELRTPLNAILGFIRLIDEGLYTSEEERKEYLRNVREGANNLLELVSNILDLSKIEAEHMTLERLDFDPLTLVEDVTKTLAPQAHLKGVEMACHAHPGLPSQVQGDPARLRQVLLNLMGNAVKFTESGAVTLTAEPAPNSGIAFVVRDTGVGIPPESQQLLFKNYVQAEGSIARRFGGTGLGLAISKELVEQMGGRIVLESQPGRGSTFRFTVPLPPGHGAAPASKPLAGVRVLAVDPHARTRDLLRLNLEALGVLVDTADTTHEAMEALRQGAADLRPFRVVVVDHQVRRDAALALAHGVRSAQLSYRPDLVYLSLIGRSDEVELFRGGGYSANLTKPVSRAVLAGTLQGLLARQGPQGAAHPSLHSGPPDRPHAMTRRPLHVLVAEDNAVNQRLIQALLTKKGFRVTLAANGRIAVEAAVDQDVDVVLMDVQMPELDGLAATREIRRRVARRLPVIAMTADAMDGDRERCLESGMDDYLTKPILPDQLIGVLAQWTDTSAQGPAVSGGFTPGASGRTSLDRPHLDAVREYARGHAPKQFGELVGLFRGEMAATLKQVDAALSAEDWSVLSGSARQLSMICAGFGAPRMQDLARELETHSRQQSHSLVRDLVVQMKMEAENLHRMLQRSDSW